MLYEFTIGLFPVVKSCGGITESNKYRPLLERERDVAILKHTYYIFSSCSFTSRRT